MTLLCVGHCFVETSSHPIKDVYCSSSLVCDRTTDHPTHSSKHTYIHDGEYWWIHQKSIASSGLPTTNERYNKFAALSPLKARRRDYPAGHRTPASKGVQCSADRATDRIVPFLPYFTYHNHLKQSPTPSSANTN
ncbi:hypothetical protein CBL_00783 [Carabus blaptoides fortunei]